jgi:hypothetical protein
LARTAVRSGGVILDRVESRRPALRVSDAEREAAISALREHFFAGRLDVEEFTERVDQAYTAKTRADLEAVGRELPATSDVARRQRKPWLLPGNTSFAVRFYTDEPPERAIDNALGAVFARLAGSGYEPSKDEPAKRIFVRDERPTWTIVVAVLLFPLGLLALTYRARSQVVVSAAADDSGVTAVDIYGTGPIAVRRAVRDHALAAG